MKNRTSEIRHRIEAEAKNLGFHSLGVTSVPVNLREDYYRDWIADHLVEYLSTLGNVLPAPPQICLLCAKRNTRRDQHQIGIKIFPNILWLHARLFHWA